MTLIEKQKKLEGIVNVIELYARPVSRMEKQEIDDLETRMEFRLKKLVEESKLKEIDIKIEIMEQVAKIVKENKLNLV